jgi:predicted DNA-binding antitoxin AbrB/MazE fold protein
MTQIEAIYQGRVFRPIGEVGLPENQRVRLSVQPIEPADVRAWLERVRQRQEKIIAERGYLPDGTPGIAEDRVRARA